MPKTQRMPQLMQRNAEDVRVHADAPVLGVVKVHVASKRLGIQRRRIERMRQNAARPVERIPIAMIARGPKNI